MVYSESPRKGLFRHVWVMGGVGAFKKKFFKAEHGRVRDFGQISGILADFQGFSVIFRELGC